MNEKLKFGLTLAACFAFLAGFVAMCFAMVFYGLEGQERAVVMARLDERSGLLFAVAFFSIFVLGFVLKVLFDAFVTATKALAEEVDVILSANPGHRVTPRGASEIREIGAAINRFAERYQQLQADVAARVEEAKAGLQEEKNRLAALMSELALSVLVCNLEGRILLYNARAKQLLDQSPDNQKETVGSALVGLGRSVFAIIDRGFIVHSLEDIHYRLQQENSNVVSQFVTTVKQGHLLRVQMAPVLDAKQEIGGFVLTLEDITRTVELGNRRDLLLQSLMERTRASLGNIRAAVENVLDYPGMNEDQRKRFTAIIRDEAIGLSGRLDTAILEFSDYLKTQWPMEEMRGADLISALRWRVETKLGIQTQAGPVDESLWLKIDSFTLTQALAYLASRLKNEFGVKETTFRLEPSGRFACLDMVWRGAALPAETIHAWENDRLTLGVEPSPLTVKEVTERHGGESWYQLDKASESAYFRLLLPLTQPAGDWRIRIPSESRPEYYDFDLFKERGQTPELDERRLIDLTYTVFDTETTGLEPSEGDEIISIGAVRIVNGRLLQHEAFEQLIDPRRPLKRESVKIHGITSAMLQGQPTMKQVLPAFQKFCEDTVLVAHNAAFDMRFLQMKEADTGVKFTHPVLDTMLLSAVVHPNINAHKLEAIAERLGVNVIGRHTALGDAIVTGEVFLRMIPLLAEQGILTLKDALEACQKTFYARIEY